MSDLPFQDEQSTEVMNALVEAAAASTQQSCALLGIKSIGVDYGLVRTGVALTIGYEPKPITILSNLNATQVAHQVVKYCQSEQIKQIIVGLPLHKNGTEAFQSTLTREFASHLAAVAMARLGPNVPVYLWDERYTSKEAAARLRSRDPNQRLYKMLDADAACIILEHYYSENGQGAERVDVPEHMKKICLGAWNAQKEEEAMQKQVQSDQRALRTQRRKEAMERARKVEEEMRKDGGLGSKKKKKKKK
jgi:putative Holliday junction resolvase